MSIPPSPCPCLLPGRPVFCSLPADTLPNPAHAHAPSPQRCVQSRSTGITRQQGWAFQVARASGSAPGSSNPHFPSKGNEVSSQTKRGAQVSWLKWQNWHSHPTGRTRGHYCVWTHPGCTLAQRLATLLSLALSGDRPSHAQPSTCTHGHQREQDRAERKRSYTRGTAVGPTVLCGAHLPGRDLLGRADLCGSPCLELTEAGRKALDWQASQPPTKSLVSPGLPRFAQSCSRPLQEATGGVRLSSGRDTTPRWSQSCSRASGHPGRRQQAAGHTADVHAGHAHAEAEASRWRSPEHAVAGHPAAQKAGDAAATPCSSQGASHQCWQARHRALSAGPSLTPTLPLLL